MKTFSSVEDYLEVLAGKRDLVTGALRPPVWLGYEFKPIVNLARYDVNFLDSVTDATLSGTALTDRQAELGIKMVQKYTRQLNAKGVSTDPLLSPVYRKPVRLIDRSRKLWIENDQLMLKFPYDTRMINELKDLLKDKQGPAGFDRDAKLWKISATEYNTNFVYYWGKSNQFEIDGAVDTLMQEILAVEQVPYSIQLEVNGDQVSITNAESSLLEYLESRGVKLDIEHLVQLVDLAPVCGYTVSEDVEQAVVNHIGSDLFVFANSRRYDLHGDSAGVERIYRYAQATNRLPMIVFDPSANNSLEMYIKQFGEHNVTIIKNQLDFRLDQVQTPIVWSHRPLVFDNIPLLISHVGLIAGAEKSMLIQNTEKLIYFNQRL